MTFGSVSATSMSSIRPPMLAGPIDRKLNGDKKGFELVLNGGAGGAPPPRWAEAAEKARRGNAANQRRRMEKGGVIRRFVLGFGVFDRSTRDRIRLLGPEKLNGPHQAARSGLIQAFES